MEKTINAFAGKFRMLKTGGRFSAFLPFLWYNNLVQPVSKSQRIPAVEDQEPLGQRNRFLLDVQAFYLLLWYNKTVPGGNPQPGEKSVPAGNQKG